MSQFIKYEFKTAYLTTLGGLHHVIIASFYSSDTLKRKSTQSSYSNTSPRGSSLHAYTSVFYVF